MATDSEVLVDGDSVNESDEAGDDTSCRSEAGAEPQRKPVPRSRKRLSAQRVAVLFSLTVIVGLTVLGGWFGFRLHQSDQVQAQRSQFLQVARQGALNLTTIDWQHADVDVRRILDGATGEFHDDFSKRSKAFIDVLQQAKATTVGTITEAGLESETADAAQALVAVSVQTSNAGEPEPVPRAWRMRIYVQKTGGQVKVSNVGFVP